MEQVREAFVLSKTKVFPLLIGDDLKIGRSDPCGIQEGDVLLYMISRTTKLVEVDSPEKLYSTYRQIPLAEYVMFVVSRRPYQGKHAHFGKFRKFYPGLDEILRRKVGDYSDMAKLFQSCLSTSDQALPEPKFVEATTQVTDLQDLPNEDRDNSVAVDFPDS